MAETGRPALTSSVCYRDPKAAYVWLEKAFGFEPSMVLLDADGNLMHSEMTFEGGAVMIGSEWSEDTRSPASLGGKQTQFIHVHLGGGLQAHFERARAAGAEILAEPQEQFYGDRTYRVKDLEGHMWVFGEHVKDTTVEDWQKEIPGVSTVTRL